MSILNGKAQGITVLLHGGAGGQDPKTLTALATATAALQRIAQQAIAKLLTGADALDVVVFCLQFMEDDPQFNAGLGSALQADGVPRLTAAIMNGATQTFSGVIGATNIGHPSVLARHLQNASSRVLSSPGVEHLARELKQPVVSLLTHERLQRWVEKAGESCCDTVGCLIVSATGQLVAGTSTGGRGFEMPGRVSDSATVAGTYCSSAAAISATGIGEQIVDDAVAARIETRRRDGLPLAKASQKTYEEAMSRGRSYGWIAADGEGHWSVAYTTPAMSYVVRSAADGEVASSLAQGLPT